MTHMEMCGVRLFPPSPRYCVRRQAAFILGNLDPIYFDPAIFNRLRQVMEEDADGWVRDAAYQALLRLASAPKKEESTKL
jgi:HEAT repeat protein